MPLSSKKKKRYLYKGLGFPVILTNVPMRFLMGEWVIDLDFNALYRGVLFALAHKPLPLTGDEVRFVRKYFEMTVEKFATLLGCTHPAVLKWEASGAHPARMQAASDSYLRLLILDKLTVRDTYFREFFGLLSDSLRLTIRNNQKQTAKPLLVDVKRDLVAAE